MTQIIVTTPEELRKVVKEAVQELAQKEEKKAIPDTINLNQALVILAENGYPTSKGKMYKLTSENKVPHRVYGNKLVFSRKELLVWAESQVKSKSNTMETALSIARSARRKLR